MSCCRWFFIVLSGCFLSPVSAQDDRHVTDDASSKELKRSALRMRVSVENLKNMREALQKATDLARRLDPLPQSMGSVGQLWTQINRPKAKVTIESLVEETRQAAESAKDLSIYQQNCSAFSSLVTALAEVDTDRSIREGQQYPAPPQTLGEGADKQRLQQVEQFQRQLLGQLSNLDPSKAAKFYSEIGPFSGADYSLRGQLAQQLASAGQKDEAENMLDDVIEDFGQNSPDLAGYQDYTQFLQQVASIDADRFTKGLGLITSSTNLSFPGMNGTWTIRVDDKSLPLRYSESRLLDILRGGFYGRPGLLIKTLDSLPELKDKVDQFGGIDSFLNPGRGYSVTYSMSPDSTVSTVSAIPEDPVSRLFKELKGRAASTPGAVRDKIAESYGRAEDVDFLINLANRSMYEDPDLASLVLEMARPLVLRTQELEKRAYLIQNLVRAYRMCDGEVDAGLIREGFVVADQLRQDAAEKGISYSAGSSPADELEREMISQFASDHFRDAMNYLQGLPDDESKLLSLLKVVETLRQNY